MTETPVGYNRVVFRFGNQMDRPLTDDDATGLRGSEITVSLGGVVSAQGTVTNAHVLDDGAAMSVTIETGGRWCAACGHVWPVEAARETMVKVGDRLTLAPAVYSRNEFYGGLPSWTRVCRDAVACRARRATR